MSARCTFKEFARMNAEIRHGKLADLVELGISRRHLRRYLVKKVGLTKQQAEIQAERLGFHRAK